MVMTSPALTFVHVALTAAMIAVILGALTIFACVPLIRNLNFANCDHRFANQLIRLSNFRKPQASKPSSEEKVVFLACPYTVEIRGLPPWLIDSKRFFDIVKDLTPADDDIVKSCVVVDMNDLAELEAELEK